MLTLSLVCRVTQEHFLVAFPPVAIYLRAWNTETQNKTNAMAAKTPVAIAHFCLVSGVATVAYKMAEMTARRTKMTVAVCKPVKCTIVFVDDPVSMG